jgi:hypothetical protein
VVAPDDELPLATAARVDPLRVLVWIVGGLLALLLAMTLIGLTQSLHGRAGSPHVPPSPAPFIPGDMPHGR